MSDKDILQTSLTDWDRLEDISDDEIDFSDIPRLTEEQLNSMKPTGELIPGLQKPGRLPVKIMLDRDVAEYYVTRAEAIETNYTSLINAVLRDYATRDTISNSTNLRRLVREIVREELSQQP